MRAIKKSGFLAVVIGFYTASNALACAIEKQQGPEGWPVFSNCPAEVTSYLTRVAQCDHYAGEISGDNTQRDAWLGKEMDALKCDALEGERAVIDKKYAADASVKATIKKSAGF